MRRRQTLDHLMHRLSDTGNAELISALRLLVTEAAVRWYLLPAEMQELLELIVPEWPTRAVDAPASDEAHRTQLTDYGRVWLRLSGRDERGDELALTLARSAREAALRAAGEGLRSSLRRVQ